MLLNGRERDGSSFARARPDRMHPRVEIRVEIVRIGWGFRAGSTGSLPISAE